MRQPRLVLKPVILLLLAVVGFWSLGPGPAPAALAHEILPAIVDISFEQDGRYGLELEVNLEALIARIEPEHGDTDQSTNAGTYDRLRALNPDELGAAFAEFETTFLAGLNIRADALKLAPQNIALDIPPVGDEALARLSVISMSGELPADAQSFFWQWDQSFGSSVVRVAEGMQIAAYSAYLVEGQSSVPLDISGVVAQTALEVATNYLTIGYTHIVPKGLDHILFVVGLFLLSTRLHPLLWQITAFTLAHTVTLALGVSGIVSVPAGIVEPLIALSIVYVAVENIFTPHLTRWRPLIVFGFGLLHGLGFAGVLTEIGLNANQFVVGLIAFNVGVELGQITIISVCFLAVGFWFGTKTWYRKFVTIPASLLIAIIGGWWVIERTILA